MLKKMCKVGTPNSRVDTGLPGPICGAAAPGWRAISKRVGSRSRNTYAEQVYSINLMQKLSNNLIQKLSLIIILCWKYMRTGHILRKRGTMGLKI